MMQTPSQGEVVDEVIVPILTPVPLVISDGILAGKFNTASEPVGMVHGPYEFGLYPLSG
jgi:hypothetical protein